MTRTPAHPVEPYIVNRWSPRSMTGEPLAREELDRLFEAARWAPSWGNSQPWRFVLTTTGTPPFGGLVQALAEFNRMWAEKAAALILVCHVNEGADGKPLPTAAFDTGAAWLSLALQARAMGLAVHAMGGFDHEGARHVCNVPANVQVECVVAVGKQGKVDDLPEKFRAREVPNDREPIEKHVIDGKFP